MLYTQKQKKKFFLNDKMNRYKHNEKIKTLLKDIKD